MRKRYWWKEKAQSVAEELMCRRYDYLDYLESSSLWKRIVRNWNLYHAVPRRPYGGASMGGGEIRIAGEDGEFRVTEINEFRSSINLLKTYIIANEPEWDALAQSSDSAAYSAAKKANNILDGYTINPNSGVAAALEDSVEHALILTAGYVWAFWDETLGPDRALDLEQGLIINDGEIRFLNPSVTEVSFEFRHRRFEESNWVHVRRLENRYDVAASSPKGVSQQSILDVETDESDIRYRTFDFVPDASDEIDEDLIWVDYAYHKQTPAMPDGRFIRFLDSGRIILANKPYLPDGHVPVYRIEPARFIMSSFGYTPAFDCQAPQELLSAVVSNIATNQNALGSGKIWIKFGEPVNYADLEPGVTAIQTPTKPEGINFLKPNPELFKAVEMYQSFIRGMSSANDTAHGDPEPNLKSGAALAFMEQRTQKAASTLVTAYSRLQMSVGTGIVKILQQRAEPDKPRNIFATGEDGRAKITQFTPEELEGVDRVAIVRGNPITRSLAGRIQIGEAVLAKDGDTSRFVELVKTGDLNALLEDRDRQLDTIKRENEALLSGDTSHVALPTDNQLEHIRRHLALLDTPEARNDPNRSSAIFAAALQHRDMMNDPEVQRWQILLGYVDPSMLPASTDNPNGPPGMGGPGGQPPAEKPPGMVPPPGSPTGEHMELSGGTPEATGAANDAIAAVGAM